jgi:glycosyltransferase involved in cell wall biosynthesis
MAQSRKNVLWLIKGLGVGGAESLLLAGTPYLDRDRFSYSVAYFLPWKNALAEPLRATGVPVHCMGQGSPFDLRAIFSLTRLVKREKIDIIHAHLPYAGVTGRLVARLGGVKAVVYSEHNVWERYRRPTYWANRLTFRMNDAVIAVSREVERSIRRGMHVNGRPKIDTILNGVDVNALSRLGRDPAWLKSEFGIPDRHRTVVNVANFTPKKRHIDLLEAARAVKAQRADVSFVLVGQGPLEEEVRRMSAGMGLDGTVVFTGFRPDARRIIASADLFVLSSQFEGLPVSMLEAMATGTPVVSTAVGGIPEVITDGANGLLVEPMAPGSLATVILDALDDDGLRERLSTRAREDARQQFDISRMVRATEDLYQSLLTGAVG